MLALRFNESQGLRVEHVDIPRVDSETPKSISSNALIRVLRAAICSTDLEITDGYVPGYDHTLGHEFVGIVESIAAYPSANSSIAPDPSHGGSNMRDDASSSSTTHLLGKRVVGEINCPCERCLENQDSIFVRNHTPNRTVLGIIGRDGACAEYVSIPVNNLHVVPDEVSDRQACFAEPLAAACRIVEQVPLRLSDQIAVVGDGKLGLLVSHVLVRNGFSVSLFGRHHDKMSLVEGLKARHLVESNEKESKQFASSFDCVIEATGSPQGILLAAALTRPLGTLILKSTCSVADASRVPLWSEIANDIVVQEKTIIGSRCGPFGPALELLREESTQRLVDAMVHKEFPLELGVEAVAAARQRGVLKVQILCREASSKQ